MDLKVAIGLIVYETIFWDGQFYLRRSKLSGFRGCLLGFALKNGPPLKIEIMQYLDLGLRLKAEILLKYLLLAP